MEYKFSYALNSGVTLGGIGAGSFEIRADGRLHEWLIFNNGPWASRRELRDKYYLDADSFLFAVRVSDGSSVVVRLLRSGEYYYGASPYTLPWLRPVESINYVGEPPFAYLRYHDRKLEKLVDIKLEAFSPLIPGDLKNSALPVAVFRFTVRNVSEKDLEVTIVAGARSPFTAGRAEARSDSVVFKSTVTDILNPLYGGSMTLAVRGREPSTAIIVARHTMRTYYGECREFVDMWVTIRREGRVLGRPIHEGAEAWGIVASKMRLKRGEESEIIFILSWYFPNHLDEDLEKLGHYYENFFTVSDQVVEYVVKNFGYLYGKTKEFHDLVYGVKGLEKWVADIVASQLTTFFKSTWLTKDGRFALWEGIGDKYYGGPEAAAFNTTDVMTYVVPTLLALYPELAKKYIEYNAQFILTPDSPMYVVYALSIPENREEFLKEFERDPSIVADFNKLVETVKRVVAKTGKDPSGRVMHFFAKSIKRVDSYHMVDLMPKFVVTAYLIAKWLGDEELLKKLVEPMMKAVESIVRVQSYNDFIPYHTYPAGFDWTFYLEALAQQAGLPWDFARLLVSLVGQRSTAMGFQTFDVWTFYGVSAYVSILWLAALRALEDTLKKVGGDASRIVELYQRSRRFVEERLWNGKYFRLWVDPVTGYTDEACMAAQLLGQWLATMAGLGYVVDEAMARSALRSVASMNIVEEEGLINGVYPDGMRPAWLGPMTYENATKLPFYPSIHMDTPWSGVEFAVASHMLYEGMVSDALRLLRIIHERYEVSGHYWNHIEWGAHYMRPLSSWGVVLGVEGIVYDGLSKELRIAPSIDRLEWILTVPGAWGKLVVASNSFTIEVSFGELKVKRLIFKTPKASKTTGIAVEAPREVKYNVRTADEEVSIEFEDVVALKEGSRIAIRLE